ncbi:MAG: hypothetical protein CL608_05335 [Anaerolineaceae bacterium]|nr:hypothetical protein [Anaerolineaceae bacterium]
MTSILLHDYVEQVDKLIDDNRLVEAIEHCRHILHHYPRHIDTYRVMGKALLEKQDYDAAGDLFLRILSADPSDFISHVGLSIIYKEEQQYDQALWHLERAYEIQPYNVAIQNELRQLYADQAEVRPGVIPLTRGALARLYMQGELYQQAISELRSILEEDPSRMDLQVLLAEAYWRDDQRIDAEEVCLNVLSELPNCIVLNAILAEIWLQTGRTPEAQKYLQRLHGLTQQTKTVLDKETIAGKAFATEGAFPLPEQAIVEYLETGMAFPDAPAVPTDDWVGEVKFDQTGEDEDSLDGVVLEPESGMHSYDWLADIGEMEGETAVPNQADSEADWFSQDKAKNELNISTGELNAEWLADLRGGEEDEADFQPLDLEGEAVEAEGKPVESDWFMDEEEDDELVAGLDSDLEDLPAAAQEQADEDDLDWLETLADDEPSLQIDSTNLMDESLIDWAGGEDEDESEPHVVQEPKTPFWLSEMADEELEAVQLDPEDALDWLGEDLEEAEAPEASEAGGDASEMDVADTAVTQPDEPADQDAPAPDTDVLAGADDWLAALTDGEIDAELVDEAEEESEADEPAQTIQLDAAIDDDELAALSDADDWMESAAADLDAILESEEIEVEEFPNLAIPELEGNEITDIPDWLDDDAPDELGADEPYTDLAEESEAAVSSEKDPQETPQAEEPQDKPEKAQDKAKAESDAFDWLDDLSADDGDIPSEPPIETEGMPSWMADDDDDEAVEVVDEWDSQSADIPGWLQEPVDLSDLDEDDSLLEATDSAAETDEDDVPGLTGLLAEMETKEEALPLDNLGDMDSLFSDWVDEDDEGGLADLVDELEGEAGASADDFSFEDSWDETAVSEQADQVDEVEEPAEPEEVGLTGLLANLNIPDAEPDSEADEMDDDFLGDLLTDADEDDLSDFLFESDDTLEPEAEGDDAIGLDDLDLENVSLTQLLSEADLAEEPAEMSSLADADEDDWLSDLTDLTEIEEEPHLEAEKPEAEEEAGLTGMLANLWAEEEGDADDVLHDLEDEPADDMSLTELLAGIDYAEDAIDSEVDLPDFDVEPEEPSLSEILSEPEPEEEDLPVSAEDTTWLMQLEEDTGSLKEQTDEFDMAEETGLDWLTTPDEPEAEAEVEEEAPVEMEVEEERVEADGTAEDWDDAMSWLEELAAQQDEPVGELPSVAETMLDEELDTPADEMQVEEFETETELEDGGLDWLTELTEEVELDTADEADELELPQMAAEEEEGEDLFDLDDLTADEGLSWLDELATGQLETEDSVGEEPETLAEPVDEPELSDLDDDSWLDELGLTDDEEDDVQADFAELPETLDEVDELADPELAVSDADLDWLDTAVDEPEEIAEEIETAVPDEEEKGPLSEEDYKVLGVTDALKESSGIEEAEADLEEALAWLDELDDEGEAEPADEAPPTLITPTYHDEADEALDDEPETVVVPPEPDELALALDRLEQQVKEEGVTVPETAVSPLLLSTAELNDALDWIEQMEAAPAEEPGDEEDETEFDEMGELALKTEAPVVETAVTQAPSVDDEDEDEIDLAAMADDPEAWLEQLLSDESDMDVEMEPPPIKPSEDAVFVTDDAPEAAEDVVEEPEMDTVEADEAADSLLDDLTLDEMPEDPDAAVAWLDQLVSGDDEFEIEMEPPPIKPSEDAVYVTDDASVDDAEPEEAAETIVDETDDAELSLEDDPEAWLEQMLGDDMSLDVDMEPPPIKPSEDAVYVTDDAPEPEPEAEIELDEAVEEEMETAVSAAAIEEDEAEVDELNLEDDPEAWLEQMLSGDNALDVDMEPPPIKPSEDAMYVTDDARMVDAPAEAGSEAGEIDEADIIADVPDDPDEAMAWLEQLAARQGADLEELPSVTDTDAEPEMPGWMAQDLEELEAEPDLEPAEPVEEDDEETAVSLDTSEIRSEVEDIDDELPDWLDEEPRGRMLGQTDWLRALPEVDVDTWLSAEEEATITSATDEIVLPDTGPLTSSLPSTPDEEEIDEDMLFEPVLEPSTGAYSVDEAKLGVAQEALSAGRIDEAITQFKELVAAGSGMMSIIAELEQAAEAYPQAPALSQVLGDAYMRNGQLQKALASYRAALDQM